MKLSFKPAAGGTICVFIFFIFSVGWDYLSVGWWKLFQRLALWLYGVLAGILGKDDGQSFKVVPAVFLA